MDPVEIKCGSLITNAALEDVGVKNYSTKRDFRRVRKDTDARREGFVPFQPNKDHATTPANLPSTSSDLTLRKIAEVRAGNGKVAVIVANDTALFRYFSLETGDYFSGDQTGGSYFVESGPNIPYFQEQFDDWIQIGSGFSSEATYWEAVQVNNTLVLNNGIDLPVTFNVQNNFVEPIYELRDQGIASVGTIWEYNGILRIGNVVQLSDTVVPGSSTSPFTTLMLSDAPYSRFSSADPSGSGYTAQEILDATNHFQYRTIWSMPGQPQRFAAAVPCATKFGSRHITLKWASKSFSNGQQILVLGAGVDGGNISATILWINPRNGTDVYLDTTMLATIASTDVQVLDSVGSIVGYEDLDDDGSAIIRGEKIRTSEVIYKDTSIFIGNYSGVAGAPFSFQRVYTGDNSIFYRNTLVSIGKDWESWHFFAGRNALYKFDLVSLTPKQIFMDVENVFFDNESNLMASPELVFASDNPITKEILLSNPGGGADTLLCFDYKYDSISTSSMQVSCAAQVQFPTTQIVDKGTSVFLMGDLTNLGAITQYGKTNDGSAPVFSRCTGVTQGAGYASVLASGLSAFDSKMNDTQISGYELRVKKLTGRVTLSLVKGLNPEGTVSLFSVDRTAANGATPALFIPCAFIGQTFGDVITVTDADVQCEVSARHIIGESVITDGAGRN